ncbi:MAG TPA: alpha/beta fold hydrolase [Candidatus Angelobacter sp.]|jgi:homoserine O-acetyltransferase
MRYLKPLEPAMNIMSRLFVICFTALAINTSLAVQTAPPAYPNQKEADFVIPGFKFQSGESLPALKLHYTTVGTPHKNAQGEIDNAVLLLHGTTGTGKNFLSPSLGGQLFGPGQPLDAAKYYLIMPDGIGRGGSSKPSDGLHAKFPHYGYLDVVEGQYRLVTEGLGIKHLRLVLGTSMGGMQVWLWGEKYPDAMDALMPIASQPIEVSGRNMLWRRLVIEAIRNDPDWNGGEYTKQPTHFEHFLPVFNFMIDSPVRLQEQAPTRAKANELYDSYIAGFSKVDANDFLYWFESSYDYNPAPQLDKIKAKLLAVNFADDELNPPELGVMEREVPKVRNGRFVLVPAGDKTRGHQTLTQAVVWKQYVSELLGEGK